MSYYFSQKTENKIKIELYYKECAVKICVEVITEQFVHCKII